MAGVETRQLHRCKIMEEALEQEAKESREKTTIECIQNLMAEMKLTAEQAMEALTLVSGTRIKE